MRMEYDDADPGWVKAVCVTCGREGDWWLSKAAAISSLRLGVPLHEAWTEEDE